MGAFSSRLSFLASNQTARAKILPIRSILSSIVKCEYLFKEIALTPFSFSQKVRFFNWLPVLDEFRRWVYYVVLLRVDNMQTIVFDI